MAVRARAVALGLSYPLGVRVVLAALVAGVALLAVPYASASLYAPAWQLRFDHVTTLKLTSFTPFKWDVRTCATKSNANSLLGKVSRKLQPVACEQPPRSNVFDGAFTITFAH